MGYRVLLSVFSFYVSLSASLSAAANDNNPLQGRWDHDRDLTLASIEQQENPPADLVKCYMQGLCGNFSIEYRQNDYRIIAHGLRHDDSYWPYRILSIEGNEVKIEERDGNQTKQLLLWKINGDVGCFTLRLVDITYNECFRKSSTTP